MILENLKKFVGKFSDERRAPICSAKYSSEVTTLTKSINQQIKDIDEENLSVIDGLDSNLIKREYKKTYIKLGVRKNSLIKFLNSQKHIVSDDVIEALEELEGLVEKNISFALKLKNTVLAIQHNDNSKRYLESYIVKLIKDFSGSLAASMDVFITFLDKSINIDLAYNIATDNETVKVNKIK